MAKTGISGGNLAVKEKADCLEEICIFHNVSPDPLNKWQDLFIFWGKYGLLRFTVWDVENILMYLCM